VQTIPDTNGEPVFRDFGKRRFHKTVHGLLDSMGPPPYLGLPFIEVEDDYIDRAFAERWSAEEAASSLIINLGQIFSQGTPKKSLTESIPDAWRRKMVHWQHIGEIRNEFWRLFEDDPWTCPVKGRSLARCIEELFWGPSPVQTEEMVRNETIDRVQSYLRSDVQSILGTGGQHTLPDRARDDFSIGYVLGFTDSALQRAGIGTDVSGMAAATIIFLEVFGDEGASFFGKAIRLQNQGDPQLLRGITAGGNDYNARVRDPELGGKSWVVYVLQ
jgi:hypothetical protein